MSGRPYCARIGGRSRVCPGARSHLATAGLGGAGRSCSNSRSRLGRGARQPPRDRPGPQPALEQELRRLERYQLLVVDGVGYPALERSAANLLFALVLPSLRARLGHRHLKPGFERWAEILGDAMVAAARSTASSTTPR